MLELPDATIIHPDRLAMSGPAPMARARMSSREVEAEGDFSGAKPWGGTRVATKTKPKYVSPLSAPDNPIAEVTP